MQQHGGQFSSGMGDWLVNEAWLGMRGRHSAGFLLLNNALVLVLDEFGNLLRVGAFVLQVYSEALSCWISEVMEMTGHLFP